MIQFNLLPDVKLEFLKARRTQRIVIVASLVTIAACVLILFILGGVVFVAQKKNLRDLNSDISTYTGQLKGTQDLDKILTVQNQLKSLPDLHNAKPAASRIFGYIQQVTPTAATISQLNVDYAQNKVTVTGNANSLDVVNVFTDTLKFTTYSKAGQTTDDKGAPAFKNVVLSQFSRNANGATYTITADLDKVIFDNKNDITLTVPKIISTRSATEQPTALFKQGTGQ